MKPSKCPICGSSDIELLEETTLRSHYHCLACDHDFFALNKAINSPKSYDEELNAEEVFKKNIDATVIIITDSGYSGTGVAIDSHHVISNAHIIYDIKSGKQHGNKVFMSFYKEKEEYPLEIVNSDRNIDLILLYSEKELDNFVTFSNRDIETGEKCYAIGNSKGLGLAITSGIVSDNNRILHNKTYILSSALTTKGNSGGPLFDRYGELIGINTSSYPDAVGMNLAIEKGLVLSTIKELEK